MVLMYQLALVSIVIACCTVSAQGPPPKPENLNITACAKCELLANRAFDYFTNFHFFKVNENNNETKPWKLAGEQSCDEFVWALQCFQHCKDDLAPGVSYSYPPRYEHLQTVIYKFCEPQWEGQDKRCRMADTRVCDMKYNKRSCGEELENWKQCMNETLEESDLDCSGVCTPARRYHKSLLYQWDLECKLRTAIDGRCGDYINLFCFGDMKDTDLSWGYFENMHTHDDDRNLTYFCEYLEEPPVCMQETVDTWLMYFGFNLTMPCSSVSDDIAILQKEWSDIVAPLCANRPNNTEMIQDVCGSLPTTDRMPSTTTTTTTTLPTTTDGNVISRRVRVKKRRRKNSASSLRMSNNMVYALTALVLGLAFY